MGQTTKQSSESKTAIRIIPSDQTLAMPVEGANYDCIIKAARVQWTLEQQIQEQKERLRLLEQQLLEHSTEVLPAVMDSLGVQSLVLGDFELSVAPILRASIPSQSSIASAHDDERGSLIARREQALNWLSENDGRDIIKDTITVEVPKGKAEAANALIAQITDLHFSFERAPTVHYLTLQKFLCSMIGKGADVPFETFAVFDGRQAKLKKIETR